MLIWYLPSCASAKLAGLNRCFSSFIFQWELSEEAGVVLATEKGKHSTVPLKTDVSSVSLGVSLPISDKAMPGN